MKKRITKILAGAMALCLMVGTFAFFTDRETQKTAGKAGSIDLTWEDISAKAGSNNEFAQDKVWDNGGLVTAGNIINPGDHFDLSYQLSNTGSKSIDVRQRIVLKSSVEMASEDAAEYHLTIRGGNDTATAVAGKLQPDKKTIVYDLKDIIIDGSKETEAGSIKDGDTAVAKYSVRLDFEKKALNAFMNSELNINLYAAAKQHRNTTNDADFPAFTNMGSIMTNDKWETVTSDKPKFMLKNRPSGQTITIKENDMFTINGRDLTETSYNSELVSFSPCGANEYTATASILSSPISAAIPSEFYIANYGSRSLHVLSKDFLGKTVGDLCHYTGVSIWPDGSRTESEYSLLTETVNGVPVTAPALKYTYYDSTGAFDGSTNYRSLWLLDESTKTFTFVTEDTVLRENLVVCVDTSNLLINTLLKSLS